MHFLVEPGFWSNQPVRTALLVGALSAIVSAVIGVFTILRSQSFAGHALTDVATTGGSGAFLFGLSPLLGFVGGGLLGAGAMDAIGVQRVRSRDLATGIVLGAATGLSALFLYLDATTTSTTGAVQQVLFGSIFTVDRSLLVPMVALSALVLVCVGTIYRPLLLSSVSPELARARAIPVRLVSLLFILALAVSVGLTAIVTGSILSTALLLGPAATALRLSRNLRGALILSVTLGVITTWLGILLAYDSSAWVSSGQGLPVSFFIVLVTFLGYLVAGVPALQRRVKGATVDAAPTGGCH